MRPRSVAFSEFAYKRMLSAQTLQSREGKWTVESRDDVSGSWYDLPLDASERQPQTAP